jgi:hypothetical protein
MAIGPVDTWIAEARAENLLPVGDASDREGMHRLFELACEETWEEAQRRCVVAQPTWADVERECGDDKVWWYAPR